MKFRRYLNILGPVALMLVSSSAVFANTVNGTFGFTSLGGTIAVNPVGSILTATSISIPAPGVPFPMELITSLPTTYLGRSNDFTPLGLLAPVTFDNYTFDLGFLTLPVFHFGTYTFSATSGSKNTSSKDSSSFLNVAYLGTFSDSTHLYDNTSASLSLTFTQTGGPGGAITYSGTFAAPPIGTPEPATMALMGGALVGLGLLSRRRLIRR